MRWTHPPPAQNIYIYSHLCIYIYIFLLILLYGISNGAFPVTAAHIFSIIYIFIYTIIKNKYTIIKIFKK